MQREVEITIGPDGQVKLEAHGFQGKGCEEVLRVLSAGFKKKSERKKPEYYAVIKSGQKVGG